MPAPRTRPQSAAVLREKVANEREQNRARPGSGHHSARQRGFYSECLDSGMEMDTSESLLAAASCGPRALDLQPKLAAPRQRTLPKSQFLGMDEATVLANAQRIQKRVAWAGRATAPSRALEPKVLVPFQPGPGKTPRRIVIERQKRLFALQDINQLEKKFLALIDYNVSITSSLYASYYFELRTLCEKAERDFTLKPLSEEQKRKLESKSSELGSELKNDRRWASASSMPSSTRDAPALPVAIRRKQE